MNNGYIAVLDSGIGGLTCIIEAAKSLYGERFLYLGDNKNVPYGNKTREELYLLAQKNISAILKYNVKAIIVGCNTLSLSVLPLIAPTLNVPIFGVYPPIDEKQGKTALFATPVTCKYFAETKGMRIFPLLGLASDIEKHKNDLNAVNLVNHIEKSADDFAPDTVILGCTHYNFIKKQFIVHFCPRKICSGERGTVKNLRDYLVLNDLVAKCQDFTVDFIGEKSEDNFYFYKSVVKDMLICEKK